MESGNREVCKEEVAFGIVMLGSFRGVERWSRITRTLEVDTAIASCRLATRGKWTFDILRKENWFEGL